MEETAASPGEVKHPDNGVGSRVMSAVVQSSGVVEARTNTPRRNPKPGPEVGESFPCLMFAVSY